MTKTITNEAGKWTLEVDVRNDLFVHTKLIPPARDQILFSEQFSSLEAALPQIEKMEKFVNEVGETIRTNQEAIDEKKQPIVDKLKQLGFSDE